MTENASEEVKAVEYSEPQAPEPLGSVNVPADQGTIQIAVRQGHPIIILGRNGTGKSALVGRFRNQLQTVPTRFMPGGRPSHLGNDRQTLTPAQRAEWETSADTQDRRPEARYRPWGGERRNERVLYDLQNGTIQHKLDRYDQAALASGGIDAEIEAIAAIFKERSPLDQANSLLRQAALRCKLLISEGELKAKQGDSIISIAQLSDGERSAVFIIAEAISAPAGTAFIIDEPERHLHRAIAVPLLRALTDFRPDCALIVSTHELELPSAAQEPMVVLVRGCTWNGANVEKWDLQVLEDVSAIDEEVRTDLLGGREKMLFVEGEDDKLDQPFYAVLFPDVSVRCRTNCVGVQRAVDGLRSTESLHRAFGCGLVDGDGMSESASQQLRERNIFPLSVYSVESLYYCDPMLRAVAKRQAETFKLDVDAMVSEAVGAALATLDASQMQNLASKKAARSVREQAISALPKPADLPGLGETVSIELESPFPGELERLKGWVADGRLFDVIAHYPVRQTHILRSLASSLRFRHRSEYETAALTRLEADKDLQNTLRGLLVPLATALGHPELEDDEEGRARLV